MFTHKIGLPLPSSYLRPAAGVLARAFQEDPFFTYALPDATRRAQVLPWFYERFLRYGLRYGKVYTTPSLEGVAIWLGPEKPGLSWLGILQSGLFLLPLKLRRPELQRSLRLSNYADRLHEASIVTSQKKEQRGTPHPPLIIERTPSIIGKHWYLCELGVEPGLQGQGVGSALIQPVLAQADRQALCCYLETNNEKNLRFYERHGFAVVKQGQVAPAAPSTWGMLRKPV